MRARRVRRDIDWSPDGSLLAVTGSNDGVTIDLRPSRR